MVILKISTSFFKALEMPGVTLEALECLANGREESRLAFNGFAQRNKSLAKSGNLNQEFRCSQRMFDAISSNSMQSASLTLEV